MPIEIDPVDPADLLAEVRRHIAANAADAAGTAGEARFDDLARRAFAFQFAHIAPYRRLCEAHGTTPATVSSWQDIPPVPTAAFRSLALAAAPAVEIFRSSGTSGGADTGADTGEGRGTHHQPYPELYRQAVDSSFPQFCLPLGQPAEERLPILSLIPSRERVPDSSLSFMAEHILARWGSADSLTAFAQGVEVAKARSWAGARQRERRPALVLATAFALAQWLDSLERQELRFRLPAGSVIFETGGFKGRTAEIPRPLLLERVADRLGVPPQAVVREYGMSELSSQCYTRVLAGEDPDLFVAPHWVRVRILDPATLSTAPAGASGLIAVLDLANLGSVLHVLTEDLGVAQGAGFRLLGRASGAELRGCSLTAEELSR